MTGKKMHLAWFSGHGLGPGSTAWNDDRMPAQMRWDRPEMHVEMAKVMEKAGFDFILFADTFGIPDDYKGSMDAYVEHAVAMPKMDPAILAPMIAMQTRSIGIGSSLSTLYYPPYLLARLTATMDHVMKGRAGWNVVTSANQRAAQNFGLDELTEHDLRYDMADEYMDVVRSLWNSWEPDALVQDARNGIFADPDKVHTIDHEGTYYKVRGPLNVVPPPQGRPLLVQAGSSGRGVQFAGRNADVVIANRNSAADMKAFRDKVRAAAADAGRDPDDIKVIFIISPLLALTEDAAAVDHRSGVRTSKLELGLAQRSTNLGRDMSRYALDEPLVIDGKLQGSRSTVDQFRELDGATPTLRQIAEYIGGSMSMPVVGSATEIADKLEELFEESGGDGFAIRGSWIPDYVNDICVQVAGTLRRRGLLAPPDPSLTLRERVAGKPLAELA